MRALAVCLIALVALWSAVPSARAQQNCPATPAAGTSNTTCANTAFVQKQLAAGGYVVGPASSVDGDVAIFSGTSGKLLKDGGSFSATLAPLVRGYLAGTQITSMTTTTITISSGVSVDDTNSIIVIGGGGTLNCGITGAGGLDATLGSLAINTWYEAFVIMQANGTSNFFASNTLTPTLPGGYTLKRRIFSFKTDGSAHIIPMVQKGDTFLWSTIIGSDAVSSTLGTGATAFTVSVPPRVPVTWIGSTQAFNAAAGQTYVRAYSPLQTSAAINYSTLALQQNVWSGTEARIDTANGALDAMATNANTDIGFDTKGWTDTRGRFN